MPKINSNNKQPGFKHALLTLFAVVGIIGIGMFIFSINLQVLLLCALSMASLSVLPLCDNYSFLPIRSAISQGIYVSLPAISTFILIGVMIAAFILSGTVPTLVYYGLNIISPSFFLPSALVLCAIGALATGSSWGTVGTIGIVLVSMGSTLGFSEAMVAGVVVSGASIGDKMSPVSDTTNLAATASGVDLFSHIKNMLYTMIPTFLITLIAYYFIGLHYAPNYISLQPIHDLTDLIDKHYIVHWICLLPLFLMLMLNVLRVSTEPAMLLSAAAATLIAFFIQDSSISTISEAILHGQILHTGSSVIDNLVSKGGIISMMETLSIALMALALGGILHHFNVLTVIFNSLSHRIKGGGKLVATTIFTTFITLVSMGEAYIAIIISGRLFKNHYEQAGMDKTILSRSLEDGGTLMTTLIPWTTGGVFVSTSLGVDVMSYAPWAIFNWLSPLVSIVFAYVGFVRWPEILNKRKIYKRGLR